jgi:polyhydroxybutyrate depolymerase
MIAGLVVVTSIAAGTMSCSNVHTVTSRASTSHKVEPSLGCVRPAPKNVIAGGGELTQSLKDGTVTGTYELSVPQAYRPRHPSPLILAFYGFGSDPAQFAALTRLPARGSTGGYLVVVPHTQGTESEWQLNGHGTDASFVDAVIKSLETTYCIDRSSVFAAGFSAGAAFTIIYSCARESEVAAIATVAVEFQLGCTRPMPIVAFHGTADPLVPYRNGAIGLSLPGIKVRGTQLNMGDWARLDKCHGMAQRRRTGSPVILQRWDRCGSGTSVELYTVVGGGHSWPGADPKLAVGLTTEQVSATSQMLSFFHRYR